MSVELRIDEKGLNSIRVKWEKWPTNIFAFWMPEVYDFRGSTLTVKEPVDWKSEGEEVCAQGVDVRHEGWSFQWSARLVPRLNCVDIELEVRNSAQKELPPLFNINGCFNFMYAPDFMDSTGEYTFFLSRTGWVDMSSLRRPQSLRRGHDPYNIPVEQADAAEGAASPDDVRSCSPLCVRVCRTRQHCIGYTWDLAVRLDMNFNRLHCIHSVPAIGPLSPGAAVKRRGKFYFHEGDKNGLLELSRAEGLA